MPEGVDLALRLAGPVPRAIAFGIDVALRGFFYFVALIVLTLGLRELGVGLVILTVFLGEVIYPVAFELLGDGRTIGKRIVGIRVVHDDGTRIRWPASLLRNLMIAADALPGTYLFALASMLCSPRFQRLGDHAAGTVVVYVERPPSQAGLAQSPAAPAPPAIPLAQAEQTALLAFAARAGELSEARREELASLATPLISPGESPAAQLDGIAAHLRGAQRAR